MASGPLARFRSDEGNFLAAGIAWTSGLLLFGYFGFLIASISLRDKFYDLRLSDMQRGGAGFLIGALIGAVVATFVTFAYQKATARDAAEWEAHTFGDGHDHH